ncbi:MAG TPA: hypothetical protein VG389_05005 [Myxococcota bacterium]|jgi:hypothetical protein|nr:hypothetical protein [Myxococcota bacterium]
MSLLDKLKERERLAEESRRKLAEAMMAYEETSLVNKRAVAKAIDKALDPWRSQLDIRASVEIPEYQWRRRMGFGSADGVVQVNQPNTTWFIYFQVVSAERWIRVNCALQAPQENPRTRRVHPEHVILRPDDAARDPQLPAYVQKAMKMFFWTISKATG